MVMDWEKHLKLRHVRTFLEIARAESVSIASERLNITQPAVSRSLRELEEMLGAPLFDRVGRNIRLNGAGRVFQSHAAASMVELMQARERLAKDALATEQLSVGALPTAASELVPEAALMFHAQMPAVRMHFQTGPNWLLFNQLRDGALDIVVGRMPEGEAAQGVTFQQLYIEDVVLVARAGHPILDHHDPRGMIADYPMILPPKGAVISQTVDRYLASVGLPEMRGTFETVALPVGRKIVMQSDALWFISRGVVADDVAAGNLAMVDLASPLLSGPVGFSTALSAPISVARMVFSDCLQELARRTRQVDQSSV